MARKAFAHNGLNAIELNDSSKETAAVHTERLSSKGSKDSLSRTVTAIETPYTGDGEPRMSKEKWLAIIALALSYTTSYQQSACTSAIIKQIDNALGSSFTLTHRQRDIKTI